MTTVTEPMATQPTRAPLRRLLVSSRPEWGRLALAAFLGALAIGCAVALLATSAWLISEASLRPPILTLEVAFVAVRAFGLGRGVFRYSERLVGHDAAFRSLSRLRVQVYERLAQLGPAGVPGFRRGDLLTRLVADVDASQDLPLRVLIPSTAAVLVSAGAVGLAIWLLPAAGLILLAALLVAGIVVPWLTSVAGRRAEEETAAARGRLTSEVVDVLLGSGELLAFGTADEAIAAAKASDAELVRLSGRSALVSGSAAALSVVAIGAAVVSSLIVAIPAVLDGKLPGVCLAVLALLPLAASEAVVALPAAALSLASVRSSATRVAEVLDAPLVVHEASSPTPMVAGPRDVSLRGVSARWSPQGEWTLRDINLELPAGHRVAVVGPSGAGKSTLASVLLHFLDHEGVATIDGVDIASLADSDLRDVVAALTQDTHVFDTTVAENLLLARRSATPDELLAALSAARLDEWLASLPQGLDTRLGAHGTGLSGGERQRLALARVLLADRPVLILDEPTEHLDAQTAEELAADLLRLTRGRTTLYITHRLSGLEDVDEIVVMESGRIIERGRHDELLAAGGAYARAATLDRGSVSSSDDVGTGDPK